MLSAIEQRSVLVHEGSVSDELLAVLVLIALATILHVLECNRVLDHVLVRRSILLRHLVVVNSVLVHSPHLVEYFHKDLVEGLVASLLAFALALVVHTRLHLVVKIFLSKSQGLEPRLGAHSFFLLLLGLAYTLGLSRGLCKSVEAASVASTVWLEVTAL